MDAPRIKCALIGSGNIGTDLLYKLRESEFLEPVWMVGIDPASEGIARAQSFGLRTGDRGLKTAIGKLQADDVRIAFDATSAHSHVEHAALLRAAGIVAIDLTPAALGPFCVPSVNLKDHLGHSCINVNLVSCGGQATIPIVAAVSRVQRVCYAEIVATVASKSAGPGTRRSIDEFTRTTALGIERVGGAERGKAIIILNPAEPPLIMRNTVHAMTVDKPDCDKIRRSVKHMIEDVKQYVPGYRLKEDLVIDENRVSVFLEVEGRGDFLPPYAGNLDIMTAAARRTGELLAEFMRGDAGVARETLAKGSSR